MTRRKRRRYRPAVKIGLEDRQISEGIGDMERQSRLHCAEEEALVGCEGAFVLRVIGVVLAADVAGDKDDTRARDDPEERPSFVFAVISVKEEGNIRRLD